jgi:excisionase family DNA binding protein
MQHEGMQRSERPLSDQPTERPVLIEPAQEPASPFMSAKDAAALLNVSTDHVIRAVLAGTVPGFKFGCVYRVLRAFVEDLYAEIRAGNGIVIEDFAATWQAKAIEGAA